MDGLQNLKFAMNEKFMYSVFSETNKMMKYMALQESPMVRPSKKKRERKGRSSHQQGSSWSTSQLSHGSTDFLSNTTWMR